MPEALIAGLFGLLIGSFLNVCIYRMPHDLSVVRPRSSCPACRKLIAWHDNIPVLSWLLLRGRCRHCKAPISIRYPAIELLTGLLFFVITLGSGPTLTAVKLCVLAAILVGLIFMDLEERILADEFTLGGTVLGIVFAWFVPVPPAILAFLLPPDTRPEVVSVVEAAFASGFLAGMLWMIGAIYQRVRGKEGLGFGDVKMIACMAAFLGLSSGLFVVIAGSVLGAVGGLLYIWLAKKDAASYELPFGSFLGLAGLVVALEAPVTALLT